MPTDPIEPIRAIRDRALSDLELFTTFEAQLNLPVSLGVFHENGNKLLEHLKAVADTSEKLIIQYESDRA